MIPHKQMHFALKNRMLSLWSKPFPRREETCPICYLDLPETLTSETVVCCSALDVQTGNVRGCKMLFHTRCIEAWLNTPAKDKVFCCPYCRERNSLIMPWKTVLEGMSKEAFSIKFQDDHNVFDETYGGVRSRVFLEDLVLYWMSQKETNNDELMQVLKLHPVDWSYKGTAASLLFDDCEATRPLPWIVRAREYPSYLEATLHSGNAQRIGLLNYSIEDLLKFTDSYGNTALMILIERRCFDLAKQLILNGADVYHKNIFNEDAVVSAIRVRKWDWIVHQLIPYGGDGKSLPFDQIQLYLQRAANLMPPSRMFFHLVKQFIVQINEHTLDKAIKEKQPYFESQYRLERMAFRRQLNEAISSAFSTAVLRQNFSLIRFIIKTQAPRVSDKLFHTMYVYQVAAAGNATLTYFFLQKGAPIRLRLSFTTWDSFLIKPKSYTSAKAWKKLFARLRVFDVTKCPALDEFASATFFPEHIHKFETLDKTQCSAVVFRENTNLQLCAFEIFLAHLVVNWKQTHGASKYQQELANQSKYLAHDIVVLLSKPERLRMMIGYPEASSAEKQLVFNYTLHRILIPLIAASGKRILLSKPADNRTLLEIIARRGCVQLFDAIVRAFQPDMNVYAPDALHCAVEYKQFGMVQYLLALETTRVCTKSICGWLPLNYATFNATTSKSRLIRVLMEDPRTDIFALGRNDRNAFAMACLEDRPGIIKQILMLVTPEQRQLLLSTKNRLGQTPYEQTRHALFTVSKDSKIKLDEKTRRQARLQEICDIITMYSNLVPYKKRKR